MRRSSVSRRLNRRLPAIQARTLDAVAHQRSRLDDTLSIFRWRSDADDSALRQRRVLSPPPAAVRSVRCRAGWSFPQTITVGRTRVAGPLRRWEPVHPLETLSGSPLSENAACGRVPGGRSAPTAVVGFAPETRHSWMRGAAHGEAKVRLRELGRLSCVHARRPRPHPRHRP